MPMVAVVSERMPLPARSCLLLAALGPGAWRELGPHAIHPRGTFLQENGMSPARHSLVVLPCSPPPSLSPLPSRLSFRPLSYPFQPGMNPPRKVLHNRKRGHWKVLPAPVPGTVTRPLRKSGGRRANTFLSYLP